MPTQATRAHPVPRSPGATQEPPAPPPGPLGPRARPRPPLRRTPALAIPVLDLALLRELEARAQLTRLTPPPRATQATPGLLVQPHPTPRPTAAPHRATPALRPSPAPVTPATPDRPVQRLLPRCRPATEAAQAPIPAQATPGL